MIGIFWIYVIDNKGIPIFLYESYTQGAQDNDHALISHFLQTLRVSASQLDIEEIKEINYHSTTYFLTKDKTTDFVFILKSIKDIKKEEVISILENIKNLFINKYANQMNESVGNRRKILNNFRDDIWNLIERKIDIGKLL